MIFSLTDGRTSAWQWDRNLSLNVDDSEYQIEEIHMSNEATKGAFVCEMKKDDRTVAIPNILLTASRDIFIYVVVSDNYGKRTELRETLHVHARKKPQDYVYTDTEVYEYRDYITRLEAVENTVLQAGTVYTLPPDEGAYVNIRVSTNEDNSKTYYIDFYIPEGQQGEPGKPGNPGNPGANGKTPYIQNGYWYIDGVNLGVKAEGKPGSNGTSVTITRIIESTESGGTNIVEFSDGSRLNVRNGKDGEDGEGGGGGVIEETDPTVPEWAKQPNKPSYTASEVGALPATTKIPTKTSDLENDNEYVQLDDLSPYAKKKDIPSVPTKVSELTNDSGYLTSVPDEYVTDTELAAKKYLTSYTETDPTVPSWAKQANKPTYSKSEVGLGNVDNVRQYSASNPPPYPVTSVNGKTGAVTVSVPTQTSQLNNNSGYITKAVSDLANYYLKSETLSKTEINALVSAIPKFTISVVSSLPTSNISETTVYLVKSGTGGDLYTEYIRVNNAWEILGSQKVDLTGYALKEDIPTKLSELDNDSGYITKAVSDLVNYYKKSEVYSKDEIDKKGFLTDHQDISGKLDASKLPEAVNAALAQAKEGGKFDGENGYTPVKGVDYFTEADKDEIKDEIITESVVQGTGNNTRLVMSQDAVTRAIEAFTALPYGGSKEWLEINGDKAKLYQIGGYVWGYVDSEGWTKSDVQFRVVRGTFEMTDTGGIPYLSCPTGATSGAVYKYTEASGDIGVPVYDSKPTTANEGDIIAVGERKYKASLTSKQVPAFTNLAVTLHKNKRYNSSGALVDQSGACSCEEYIPFGSGTVVRIKGLGDLNTYNCMGYDNASTTVRASFKPAIKSVSGDYLTYSYDSATGTATLTSKGHSYVQRMRVSGVLNGSVDDVIITVNEKISYNTETTVTWTDIGAYTPPTEAGWSATDEVYNVIDSLDATASNGESAVYRADGFLYSFVGGSDWVQMSRYDAPTIAIDGDLSDSSTNAVQNKIVTKQFNDIHSKVNTHTNELSAIKDQIGNIATIPSFWQSAVDSCIAKIKVLQKGRNCVTFPFFSDNHTRDGKTQYMGILIAHIMKECGIPYCFFGGDAITSAMASTADSDAEFKAMAKAFDTAMSYIPDGRFFMALGNHETWLVANPNIEGSTRVDYDRNQQYEIFLRNKLSGQNAHLGGDGTYYYVDDNASKVRWIVLNTNGIGDSHIDTEQLWWFEGEALHFTENGWGVVIISHIPITNHYEQSNIGNNTDVIDIVKRYKEAVGENQADIIGWYSGHIHRDRIYSGVSVNDTDDSVGKDMGFKQVTITSDHTSIAYPIGNSPTYHPVADDALSHAIDFVTINKDLRQVNITRLGIGEDRNYTY